MLLFSSPLPSYSHDKQLLHLSLLAQVTFRAVDTLAVSKEKLEKNYCHFVEDLSTFIMSLLVSLLAQVTFRAAYTFAVSKEKLENN